MIILISASQVARITGVSHLCPANKVLFKNKIKGHTQWLTSVLPATQEAETAGVN
jgi:hypothetical protein